MNLFTLHLGDRPENRSLIELFLVSLSLFVEKFTLHIVSNIAYEFYAELKNSSLSDLKSGQAIQWHSYDELNNFVPAIEIYHDGINDYGFERMCYKRFFIMQILAEQFSLAEITHIDADILLIDESCIAGIEADSSRPSVKSHFKTSSFCSTWNLSALQMFTTKLNQWTSFCNVTKPQRCSDMQYLAWLVDSDYIYHSPLTINSSSADFDNNVVVDSILLFLLKNIEPIIPVDANELAIAIAQQYLPKDRLEQLYPPEYVISHFSISKQNRLYFHPSGRESRPTSMNYLHLQGGGVKSLYLNSFRSLLGISN
jgi:hypothetical protein